MQLETILYQPPIHRISMPKNDNYTDAPKRFQLRSALIQEKIADLLKQGSFQKVEIKKGKRTIIKVPLTVGIGSATAAILLNAPLTAVAAIVAMSNDVSIKLRTEKQITDA